MKKNSVQIKRIAISLIVLFSVSYGTYNLFRSSIDSRLNMVVGDMGDARLCGLFLEHSHLFFSNRLEASSFWSPNWQFYPHRNTFAYSVTLISAAPVYSVFRLLGYEKLDSLQLWMMACCVLNFFAFLLLCKVLQLSWGASVLASAIFAFGLPRAGYLNHPQLFPQFFSILGFVFLRKLYLETQSKKSLLWGLAAGSMLALQFWASVYLFWFSGFALLIALTATFSMSVTRCRILFLIKTKFPAFAIFGVSLFAILFPIVFRYLEVKDTFGGRNWANISGYLPEIQQIFYPVPYAKFYHWLWKAVSIPADTRFWEKYVFTGFIPMIGFFALLILALKKLIDPWLKVLLVTTFVTWIAPYNIFDFKVWSIFYSIPGADAISVPSRMILLTLGLAGLCTAFALDLTFKKNKFKNVILFILLFLFLTESTIKNSGGFEKEHHKQSIKELAEELEGKSCEYIYYSGNSDLKKTISVMWLAQDRFLKTFNGYSGNTPAEALDLYRYSGYLTQPYLSIIAGISSEKLLCVF